MQQKIFFAALAMMALSCNNAETKTADSAGKMADSTAKPPIALPYTATYSSSFETGNPAYVQTILKEEWKAWEEGKLDNMKSWLADTVLCIFGDNTVVKGADTVIAVLKKYRATLSAVNVSIGAVTPVYSTDKKENWVLVWATETDTRLNGAKDTTAYMESWRFNKDGKADLLMQYDRARRKM